jgi:hypothetical protein
MSSCFSVSYDVPYLLLGPQGDISLAVRAEPLAVVYSPEWHGSYEEDIDRVVTVKCAGLPCSLLHALVPVVAALWIVVLHSLACRNASLLHFNRHAAGCVTSLAH